MLRLGSLGSLLFLPFLDGADRSVDAFRLGDFFSGSFSTGAGLRSLASRPSESRTSPRTSHTVPPPFLSQRFFAIESSFRVISARLKALISLRAFRTPSITLSLEFSVEWCTNLARARTSSLVISTFLGDLSTFSAVFTFDFFFTSFFPLDGGNMSMTSSSGMQSYVTWELRSAIPTDTSAPSTRSEINSGQSSESAIGNPPIMGATTQTVL